MSTFTTPADLRMLEKYKFELLADFEYHVGAYPSADVIRVPAGFVTDLASIPRVMWNLLPPHGRYAKAAIVHDYMYASASGPRAKADRIFFEAMRVLKVKMSVALLMYTAVRFFGRKHFGGAR